MIVAIFCLFISLSISGSEESFDPDIPVTRNTNQNIVTESEMVRLLHPNRTIHMYNNAISIPDSSIVDHAKKATVVWLFLLEEILKFRKEIFK